MVSKHTPNLSAIGPAVVELPMERVSPTPSPRHVPPAMAGTGGYRCRSNTKFIEWWHRTKKTARESVNPFQRYKLLKSVMGSAWVGSGRAAHTEISPLTRALLGGGGVWTPPSGFSRLAKIRRRAAPPGFHPPYPPHLFRNFCENFDPMPCEVRSPGQVKWPNYKITFQSRHGYNVSGKVMKLS